MDSSKNQIVTRKRTFWKMVKTIFVPAQSIAKLMVGCGGKSGKGKRRLTMRNMHQAKEAFMRASLQGAINRSNSQRISSENAIRSEIGSNLNRNTNSRSRVISRTIENENLPTPLTPYTGVQQQNIEINEISSASTSHPLHAPLNLAEAEFLLESLTLSSQPSISTNNVSQNNTSLIHLEVVDVEINSNQAENDYNLSALISNEPRNEDIDNNLIDQDRACEARSLYESDDENDGNRNRSLSMSASRVGNSESNDSQVILPRSRTTTNFVSSVETNDFSGWRKSSIEVSANPPVTLAFIPSGLCVGDRVVWVKDDHPEIGTVRWIGKIRQQFYSGIEFDKPVGNSSGIYGYGIGMYKRLFTCQLPYGRFVPVKELVLYKDYHDSGVKSGIVCIICRDDFLETWEPDILSRDGETSCGDDIQPFNMVSTRCGHLYHWGCLDHWFSTKKRAEFHCPFCSKPMERTDVIRIFPSQL